jgi:hypothetical protein
MLYLEDFGQAVPKVELLDPIPNLLLSINHLRVIMNEGRVFRVEPVQVERALMEHSVVLSHKLESNEVDVRGSVGRRESRRRGGGG